MSNYLTCPRCESTKILSQATVTQKRRGFLSSIMWIVTGLWVIALLRGRESVGQIQAVCQDCGQAWIVKQKKKSYFFTICYWFLIIVAFTFIAASFRWYVIFNY